MLTGRSFAYATLRATVGFVFLFFGIGKFVMGVGAAASGMQQMFAKTWMPPASVYLFSSVLPYLEVTLGMLLVLGLFSRWALGAAALLILMLTAGLTIAGVSQGVALNLVYALALFLLQYRVNDDNQISLDALLGR